MRNRGRVLEWLQSVNMGRDRREAITRISESNFLSVFLTCRSLEFSFNGIVIYAYTYVEFQIICVYPSSWELEKETAFYARGRVFVRAMPTGQKRFALSS